MNVNEAALTKLLKQIVNTDKTPPYKYYGEGTKDDYLTANGASPMTGHRWNTPKEICDVYLRHIERGTLEDAIKRLMEAS